MARMFGFRSGRRISGKQISGADDHDAMTDKSWRFARQSLARRSFARRSFVGVLAGAALFGGIYAARDMVPAALGKLDQAVTALIWTHALEHEAPAARVSPALFATPVARSWQMREGASGDLILELDGKADKGSIMSAMAMLGCVGKEWAARAPMAGTDTPYSGRNDTIHVTHGFDQLESGDLITLTSVDGSTHQFRVEKTVSEGSVGAERDEAPRIAFQLTLPDGKTEITLKLLDAADIPETGNAQIKPQREL